MRAYILFAFICTAFCLVAGMRAPKEKPNFIIFYADDLGYGDLTSYGHPTIQTPNLDYLGLNGIRFTQGYTAAPICSPSRGSIMTGRIPYRNGVYSAHDWPEDLIFRVFLPWSSGGLPLSEVTIAEVLKPAGYTTGLIGKWHLGLNLESKTDGHYLPTRQGFDYFYGLPWSQDEGCPTRYGNKTYCDKEWEKIWPGVPLYENETILQQPVDLENLTPRYNQKALQFLENNKNDPFFLYMAYDEVHVPLFASPQFLNTSARGLYGDAVNEMDHSIGLITQKLKDLGISENTLIIFASDNGPWITHGVNGGSAGLLKGGKGSTWEGGIRSPFIAYWPGVIQPRQPSLELVSTLDLLPTFAELAGAQLNRSIILDGKSITPIFEGKGGVHTFLYFYRDHELMAVRYGNFKGHFITRCGFCEDPPEYHDPPLLFDLGADPGEQYPLEPSKFKNEIQIITTAASNFRKNMVGGPAELDKLDPFLAPCCRPNADTCACG